VNLKTLFQLLTQGFRAGETNLEEEASKLEKAERAKSSAKDTTLSEYKRIGHFDDPLRISRWLREEGRGVKIEAPKELEIWQKGEHFRLAIRTGDQWEVYIIIPDLTTYQLRRKLV
jgi:hypothetical protein